MSRPIHKSCRSARSATVALCSLFVLVALAVFMDATPAHGQRLLDRIRSRVQAGIDAARQDAANEPPQERSILVRPAGAEVPASETASIGVRVGPLTPESRTAGRIPVWQGAFVQSVHPGGPAEKAKIPSGAVIVAVAGVRIDTPRRLVEEVSRHQPGDTVTVTYFDGPQLIKKNVTLAARDGLRTEDVAREQPADPVDGAATRGAKPTTTPVREIPAPNRIVSPDRPVLRAVEGLVRDAIEGPAAGNRSFERTIPPTDEAGPRRTDRPEIRLPPPREDGARDTPPPESDASLAAEVAELREDIRRLNQRVSQLEQLLIEAAAGGEGER